ncbi:hypothetical protein Pelo_11204 [Pelomyxa schiedti]|nr:hypothetical protein Pelo_11204 [Pelomyxa schiedti]
MAEAAMSAVVALKYDWVIMRGQPAGKCVVLETGRGGLQSMIPNLSPSEVLLCFFHASKKGKRLFFFLTWVGDQAPHDAIPKLASEHPPFPTTTPPIVTLQCGSYEELALTVDEYLQTVQLPLSSSASGSGSHRSHGHKHHHRSDKSERSGERLLSESTSKVEAPGTPANAHKHHSRHSSEPRLLEELEKAKEEIRALKEQLTHAEATCEELRNNGTQGMTTLQQKYQALAQEIQQFKDQRRHDSETIKSLQVDMSTLRTANANLQQEKTEINAQLCALLQSQLNDVHDHGEPIITTGLDLSAMASGLDLDSLSF